LDRGDDGAPLVARLRRPVLIFELSLLSKAPKSAAELFSATEQLLSVLKHGMFLLTFLPKHGCGCLGKNPAAQWAAVQGKVRSKVDLTNDHFDAKEEDPQRGLRVIEQSVQDSQAAQGDKELAALNAQSLSRVMQNLTVRSV
jgi:hypothetical protein